MLDCAHDDRFAANRGDDRVQHSQPDAGAWKAEIHGSRCMIAALGRGPITSRMIDAPTPLRINAQGNQICNIE
jgi:hypothetical protein